MFFGPRAILPVILTFLLMAVVIGMALFYFLAPVLGAWLTAMLSILGGFWSGRLLVRYMYGIGKEALHEPPNR